MSQWTIPEERQERLVKRLEQVPLTVESVWRAYLFSRLSVQTPLALHEASFNRLIKAAPNPWAARRIGPEGVARALQGTPFWKTKTRDIIHFLPRTSLIWAMLKQWEPTPFRPGIRGLRQDMMHHLPGLAYAKTSFMLMLLGFTDAACIDTHMVRVLGLSDRPTTPKKYELAEARIKRRAPGVPIGVAQWVHWIEARGVDGVGHDVYFQAQGVN